MPRRASGRKDLEAREGDADVLPGGDRATSGFGGLLSPFTPSGGGKVSLRDVDF